MQTVDNCDQVWTHQAAKPCVGEGEEVVTSLVDHFDHSNHFFSFIC